MSLLLLPLLLLQRDNIWSQIKGGDWPCPTAFTCLQSFVAGKDALGPSLSLKQGFTHKGFLWKHTVIHVKYMFYLATRVLPNLLINPPGNTWFLKK